MFIYLLPIYFRFDPRVGRYEKSFPFLTCSLYLKKYILSHIASWIICLFLGESLTSNDIPFWGHVRVHIFKGPIINESTKSLGIKSKSRRLISQYIIFLHMVGRSKMNERLNDMTTMLLQVSVLPKKNK